MNSLVFHTWPLARATITTHAAVVIGRLTNGPITSGRRVSNTIGTRANGMPKDSTICDPTRLSVVGSPRPSTTSAGSIVNPRRRNSGMRRRMKPCMTTCPA